VAVASSAEIMSTSLGGRRPVRLGRVPGPGWGRRGGRARRAVTGGTGARRRGPCRGRSSIC
jgi:hypothetical protein